MRKVFLKIAVETIIDLLIHCDWCFLKLEIRAGLQSFGCAMCFGLKFFFLCLCGTMIDSSEVRLQSTKAT